MVLQTIEMWGAVVAFAVTLVLQKLLVPVASRLDLMDYPAGRKDHSEPTPVIGGVAMLVGILLATLPAAGQLPRVEICFGISVGNVIHNQDRRPPLA